MMAMTSRMLLVRIAGVPACFAALAIRYITDFSSTYSGSPSTAWQEMIICPRILLKSSCLSITNTSPFIIRGPASGTNLRRRTAVPSVAAVRLCYPHYSMKKIIFNIRYE